MGMRSPARSRTGLWLGVGVAAAAVLMVALSLVDGRERPRRGRATAAPEPIGHGAYHLREGVNHVEVEAPTLLETQAGVVELEPGKYEVRLGPDRVTVVVEKGRAVLRNARERHVVEAGGSGTLAEMSATAIAVESIARAEEGGGAEITGFVYDRDRQPVANARIWVSRGAARNDGEELGKTSEDGSFRVGGIGGAVRYVGARAAGWAPADLRRIEPAESPVFEMNFLLRHKGGALAVTVTDTDGSPVPGATVVAGGLYRDTPEKTKSPEGYPLVATGERTLVADAGGVARTDGMPPQWAKLRVLEKGLAPFQGRVRVSPEGVTRKDVILARGARVTGVVRVARAVAGGAQIMFLDVAGGRIVTPQSFWTRVDGSFEVEHAPLGKVRIVAVADGGAQASAWLDLEDGATLEWNATLSPAGSIEGKLVLESGAPLAQALVRCTPAWQQSRAPVSVRTEADGTFRFEKLAPERYRISVWYPGVQKARMQPPAKEVYVTLDEGPIRVELPDRDEELEPGFLAGTLLRGDGGVAAEAEVHAWPPDRPGSGLRARTAADGTFRLGPLAPGEYFMELHLDGEPTLHLDGFDVRTGETNDLGAVYTPGAGDIVAGNSEIHSELLKLLMGAHDSID